MVVSFGLDGELFWKGRARCGVDAVGTHVNQLSLKDRMGARLGVDLAASVLDKVSENVGEAKSALSPDGVDRGALATQGK